MPIIESEYKCHRAFRNGHIQTILPLLTRRKPKIESIKEVFITPDNDRLTTFFYKNESSLKLTIITHGLEGTAEDPYIISMAKNLVESGYNVLTWCMRSCDGQINHTPKFYNAMDFGDLEFLIDKFETNFGEINLVGISLGGSVTANYVGRKSENILNKINKTVLISTPLDLVSSAKSLESNINRYLYHWIFVSSMKKKVFEKSKIMELPIDLENIKNSRFIGDIDEHLIRPLYGFESGHHYRTEASSLPFLHQTKRPIFILNAQDDPFLAHQSLPFELAKSNELIFLEAPRHGGHVGFIKKPSDRYHWQEKRLLEFLNSSN